MKILNIKLLICITHLCRLDSSTLTLWTGSFQIEGMCGLFLSLPWFIKVHVLNANSVDPYQTPCSVASDQGVHCLPMSLLWSVRHEWFKHIKRDCALQTSNEQSNRKAGLKQDYSENCCL